jgi:hypothetical protein
MVSGLVTVAGSVLVGHALVGADLDHLIAAAFMAARCPGDGQDRRARDREGGRRRHTHL